ncbi:hypothetical protein BVRB_4g082880 [Beta vulgaris subsp. vulgaris]|nr:hypothetical protein BVRB_4g082880 [Beta vulgaris subsp. vulgaris]
MEPEMDRDVPTSPPIRLSEEIRGIDGYLVSTRVPCEDPSSVPEVVPLPSPSDSLSEEDEGVVPGPFEVSLAHKPCSSSYLDRLISDRVVMVSEEAEDEAPTTSGQAFPPLDLEGGPHSYYPDATFMNYMERNAKNLTLTNLLPNSWLSINGFIAVCELLNVTLSLRLWRNLFTLMLGPADLHGPGGISFNIGLATRLCTTPRRSKRTSGEHSTIYARVVNMGSQFAPDEGPRFRLNQTVPEMSREEAVVGVYLSTTPRIVTGDLAYVPSNWLPTYHKIRNEMFLVAVSLSRSCDKALTRHRLDPAMAERFINFTDLAAKLMAELDAETMFVPPPPKDTEAKKAKRPHVYEKTSSGVSSGSKRGLEVATEDALVEYEEPPRKRSLADKFGVDVPFTSITKAQKIARVKAAVHTIYTDADDEALLNLVHGKINALYESWLVTSIRMTSVINRRSQFEKGVDQLNAEIETLKKQVTDYEAEISKLNTELDSQKETFEKPSKVVNESDELKEKNKMVLENLHAATIDRNAKQKELDELKLKLSGAEKKVKRLVRKLEEALSRESALQVGHDKFLEGWKRSPEGLTFLGQMASRSYRLAVTESKERLKGILAGPDSSLD